VREIADAARTGDGRAVEALRGATTVLGRLVGPRVREFGAELLVVGGSIAGSWDLLGPWFAEAAGDLPLVVVSGNTERAGMLGAAVVATERR
jgi:glucokinase